MDAVHQTFDRINTSISITMAAYIANFLVIFMMRIQVILVGAVTFAIMTCLMIGLLRGSRIMITFRSIVGIVVVNTIMQVINDIGSSSVISDSSSVILASTTMRGSSTHIAASIILGTCFALAAGNLKDILKGSEEGSAIYMGIQYAYSDILIGALKEDLAARNMIAAMSLVLLPWIQRWKMSFIDAISFTCVTFVIDSIIPKKIGDLMEDIPRDIACLLLICGMFSQESVSKDITPFALWRIARRLSSALVIYYDGLHMLVAVMVLYWFMGMWKKRDKEGGVVDIFMDLFVLMGVYLSSSWIMDATQRGSVGDILIMLACTASIARMVLEHLF